MIFLEGKDHLVSFDFFIGKVQYTNDNVSDLAIHGDGGAEAKNIKRADTGFTVNNSSLEAARELGRDIVDGFDILNTIGENGLKNGRGVVTGIGTGGER